MFLETTFSFLNGFIYKFSLNHLCRPIHKDLLHHPDGNRAQIYSLNICVCQILCVHWVKIHLTNSDNNVIVNYEHSGKKNTRGFNPGPVWFIAYSGYCEVSYFLFVWNNLALVSWSFTPRNFLNWLCTFDIDLRFELLTSM